MGCEMLIMIRFLGEFRACTRSECAWVQKGSSFFFPNQREILGMKRLWFCFGWSVEREFYLCNWASFGFD